MNTQKQIDELRIRIRKEEQERNLSTMVFSVIVCVIIIAFTLLGYDIYIQSQLSHKADRICVNETIDILCSDWVIQDNECPVPYNKTICLDKIEKEVCTIK